MTAIASIRKCVLRCALSVLALSALPASADALPDRITALLGVACDAPYSDPQRFRSALGDIKIISHTVNTMGDAPGRAKTVLIDADGSEIQVSTLFPAGRLRRIGIEISDPVPRLSVNVDHMCRVTEVREIVYTQQGIADAVRVFSADMQTKISEEPLNPPAPIGEDPGGVTVGVIDSGINYTVAPFLNHLARNAEGGLIGLDLWDMDNRPFDVDTSRSPFFPLHHGSAVASVLIREAPMTRIIPVRYPRPDMTRLADAVTFLAEYDVRIVNMAMGSNNIDDWTAFATAAKQHPNMLFILSAGNNGRDIDQVPVYPAALGLPNTIVVTSSMLDGRLAQGSNWGAQYVDIMVPGERVDVIDHRGAVGKASGSSFAVPRVSALAVRLLAAHPDWQGPELRDAILKRTRPLRGPRQLRYGWIPDPTDGP